MDKKFRELQKEMMNPYFYVNWVYAHFNQQVPKVNRCPKLEDYGLPQDTEEILNSEEKRAEKTSSLVLLGLYILGFCIVTCLIFFIPDYDGTIWTAAGASLFTYGWMAILGHEVFLSGIVDKIIKRILARSEMRKTHMRYLDDLYAYWYWQEMARLDFWMSLTGHQFEDAVAAVFRRAGYDAKVSKHGGDGGVDIVLQKEGKRIAVQCKAHKTPIGPSVARDLLGTMAPFGFDEGIIASRSGFTGGVYEFTQDKRIALMDLAAILKMDSTGIAEFGA